MPSAGWQDPQSSSQVRYHESIETSCRLTILQRAATILAKRRRIKREMIATRRLQHQRRPPTPNP